MASNNIEIESKVLLSKSDYEKIIVKLNFGNKNIVQTNYYLDSEDRDLKNYGMVLRVRKTVDVVKLTMKAPMSEGLLEKNQVLNEKESSALLDHDIFPRGDIHDFLEILHIDPSTLKVLANLTTERKEIQYQDTMLDVSKNTYSGKVDYELECDSDSTLKSQGTLRDICSDLDIEFKLNTLSKETRAINAATGTK
ncbi:MAG: CYTH domain-containing protein [Bacilli bacterium]